LVEAELLPTVGRVQRAPQPRPHLHADAPFVTKGRKPAFHTPLDNFASCRLWQRTEYERCVFIDADALVLREHRQAVRLSGILRRAECL
jgi:alpha-N-acetylglucosamine transferase